jgi:hypothetical protein
MLSFKKFIQYLEEALNWLTSSEGASDFNPGKGDYALVFADKREDHEYITKSTIEKTHDMMSHAIHHLHEFDNGFVMKKANEMIAHLQQYLNANPTPTTELILFKKVLTGIPKFDCKNEEALKKIASQNDIKKSAILNSFRSIHNKQAAGKEITSLETHIHTEYMVPLERRYEEVIERIVANSIDVDRADRRTLLRAIASGKTIKFTANIGIRGGEIVRPIYINFRDTSYISSRSSDTIATAFKLIKAHNQNVLQNLQGVFNQLLGMGVEMSGFVKSAKNPEIQRLFDLAKNNKVMEEVENVGA